MVGEDEDNFISKRNKKNGFTSKHKKKNIEFNVKYNK